MEENKTAENTEQTHSNHGNSVTDEMPKPDLKFFTTPVDIANISPPTFSTPIGQSGNPTPDDTESYTPFSNFIGSSSFSDATPQDSHFDQELENQIEQIYERFNRMKDRIFSLQKSALAVSQKLSAIECV